MTDSQAASPSSSLVGERARVFALVPLGKRTLAVGSAGLIVDSDSGQVFSNSGPAGARNLYTGLKDSSGRVWLGSDSGTLYLGDTTFQAWRKVDLHEDSAVFAISEMKDGSLIAVGQYGLIRMKSPGSEDWKTIELPWKEWLESAWQEYGEAMPHLFGTCQSGGSLFVVGEFGIVLKYDGRRWSKRHGGSIEPALYSCAGKGDQLISVGQRGTVLRSADAGETWTETPLSGPSIYRVIALPNDYWLAVGEERRILWTQQENSEWKCGHIDPATVGWLVDAQLSPDSTFVTLAGAGALFPLSLTASGTPDKLKDLTCG